MQAWGPITFLKRDSNAGVFDWNLQNSYEKSKTVVSKKIKKYSGRISKIKHFTDKNNGERISFLSETDAWNKFKKQLDDCSKLFIYDQG